MDILANALAFVEEFFSREYSGHDSFHTLRVYRLATGIAKAENARLETVQLAALLHDVDDRKLSPETCENKLNARRFLEANGLPPEQIEEIIQIIGEVSFAGTDSVVPATLEGKCVQDADRLDAIGAIGIGRAFAYGGNHHRLMHHPDIPPRLQMSKDAYYGHESTTVNHFYEKLFLLAEMMNTETAKAIAQKRHERMQEFIDAFLAEWDGSQ